MGLESMIATLQMGIYMILAIMVGIICIYIYLASSKYSKKSDGKSVEDAFKKEYSQYKVQNKSDLKYDVQEESDDDDPIKNL